MLNHTKQLVRVLYLVRLRALLGLAGIDISRFKPHSVRASSTSAATLAKVLLDAILRTAGWSRHSTFAKYYKRKPKNMRIWQKLKFDGNSIESSWGARDDMPTLTCIWNKPTQYKSCSPFKVDFWDWIAQSHVTSTSWWLNRITIKLQLIGKSRLTLSLLSYSCKTVGVCSMN